MAWTSPRTWTAEVLTSTLLNTHLRDNLSYLKDAPTFDGDVTVARAQIGGTVTVLVSNSDTTNTGSHAKLRLNVGGSGAGDPYLEWRVTGATIWAMGIDNSDNDLLKIATSSDGPGAGSAVMTFSAAGLVAIGDTTNADMTVGLTINQGDNDDQALALKSTDVVHGITTQLETDTFADFAKYSATAGGLKVRGITASAVGINLRSYVTSGDDTKSTAGVGAIHLESYLKLGTSITNMSANANLMAVNNGANTRFILDADGDSHQDVGTAWTNFDEHDDVALLNLLSAHVTRRDDPLRASFRAWLSRSRKPLERARLVTFNRDGHHFVNWSRMHMLEVGALRQLAARVLALESAPPNGRSNGQD